jgi:hypothetical protein
VTSFYKNPSKSAFRFLEARVANLTKLAKLAIDAERSSMEHEKRQRNLRSADRLYRQGHLLLPELCKSGIVNREEEAACLKMLLAWLGRVMTDAKAETPTYWFGRKMATKTIADWVVTAITELKVRQVIKNLTPQWRQVLEQEGVPPNKIEARLAQTWWTWDKQQSWKMSNGYLAKEVATVVERMAKQRVWINDDEDEASDAKCKTFSFATPVELTLSSLSKWRTLISNLDPKNPLHPFTINGKFLEYRLYSGPTSTRREMLRKCTLAKSASMAKTRKLGRPIASGGGSSSDATAATTATTSARSTGRHSITLIQKKANWRIPYNKKSTLLEWAKRTFTTPAL